MSEVILNLGSSQVATNTSDIATLQSTVTTIGSDLDTAEATLTTVASRVTTAEADILSLEADVSTAQGQITTLQSTIGAILKRTVNNLGSDFTTFTQLGVDEITGLRATLLESTTYHLTWLLYMSQASVSATNDPEFQIDSTDCDKCVGQITTGDATYRLEDGVKESVTCETATEKQLVKVEAFVTTSTGTPTIKLSAAVELGTAPYTLTIHEDSVLIIDPLF